MNKIPNAYKSVLSVEKTHKLISEIKRELMKEFVDKLNVLEIQQPIYSKVKSVTELKVLQDGRPISFDSSEDNSVYYVLNDFSIWMMNSLIKLDRKNNSGVISEIKYINRDINISNTRSFEKNIFSIEYAYDNNELIINKSIEIINEIYMIINLVIENIKKDNPELKIKKIPSKLKTVEIDSYEDVLESSESSDVVRQQGMVMVNKKLKDDEILTTKQKSYILFYEKKAFTPDILIESSIRKGSNELPEQLETVAEGQLDVIRTLIKEEWKSSINITINIDHILMIALNKSHILEVQSGVHSNEIEEFLSDKGIKHL